MRLLRSIHSLDPSVGGPIESVRQSSALLREWGHDVEIATLDAAPSPWLKDIGLPVHAFGPGRGSYGFAPQFVDWLRSNHARFDAVIVHGLWQYSSFGVWRALHGTATPYFVFPHGMLDPWFNRTYPLKRLKKMLYWPWGEYRVLRDAAAVLFTSEEEARLAAQSFSPYRCNGVVVSYGTAAPAVDLNAARDLFLSRFPHLRGQRLLLFLGRVHEKKGCDLLIKAFAELWRGRRLEGVHLVIAGPASDDSYLNRLKIANAEHTQIPLSFIGMVSGELKWGAFAAADAFVLPSHQENFGIAVVEALACGTPVFISTQVNIWREIVADGAGAAGEDTEEGTRQLLEAWLSMSETGIGEMREAARRSFANRFELRRATESLLTVIDRFIGFRAAWNAPSEPATSS